MEYKEQLPAVIDALYAGTLDDAVWEQALVQTADLVGGSGIHLFALDPRSQRVVRDEALRMDPAHTAAYRTHWHSQDVFLAPSLAMPAGIAFTDRQLLPIDKVSTTAIWNQFMVPTDCHGLLMSWLHKSHSSIVALSIKGTRKKGWFGERDLAHLRCILPHLQRSFQIRDRLQAHELHASSLSSCLDRTSFAVFMLDELGQILQTNARAEEILRTERSHIACVDRRLQLGAAAQSAFRRWIEQGAATQAGHHRMVHLHRRNRAPLSLLALALSSRLASWCASHPSWLVLVFDPQAPLAPATVSLLRQDLDISEREAQLALHLSGGLGVQEAAQRMGIAVETARSHLKAIFSKTGVSSQAQLTRRVLMGAAALVVGLQEVVTVGAER